MFSIFSRQNALQGYKITNVERSKKYGVAANSLKMLKEKAGDKFKIPNCRVYLAQDGVEVQDEEYFMTLPAQILFIVADKDTIVKTDFELMYDTIKLTNIELLQAGDLVKDFVCNNQNDVSKILLAVQRDYDDKVMLSGRNEDKHWFLGVDDKSATKEQVMARRSQDRIRGYFYKTKEELTKCALYRRNNVAKELIDEMIELFRQFLTGFDYFSCMFDRKWAKKHDSVDEVDAQKIIMTPKKIKLAIKSAIEEDNIFEKYCVALCSNKGDFRCQGLWNKESCNYKNHLINPYASRENLILFQIWNLDHQIEISRTVLPSIIENLKRMSSEDEEPMCKLHKRRGKNLSVITYFLELFTLDNLKLVHIVCHDKSVHEMISNGNIICEKCAEYKYIKEFQKKIHSNKKSMM